MRDPPRAGTMPPMTEITLTPPSHPPDQTIHLPGSKSLTNRALVAAALANGRSRLDGILIAEDTRLMMDALAGLGIRIEANGELQRAVVHGGSGYWPRDEADLFCGNAGTVLRFLTAACSVGYGDYRLDGTPRMRQRPLGDLVTALRDLGATIGFEMDEGYCPVRIKADGLRGGKTRFADTASSQFVTAVLLAAPRAMADVMIEIAGTLPSRPYVEMTLSVMEAFGTSAVWDINSNRFIVPAAQTYQATNFTIEPDATAASYFFAAAALTGGRITIPGLGTDSRQGDVRFVDVLEKMGCTVERGPDETTVRGPADGVLHGIDVDLIDMPDVAQTLAVVAAFADGPTRIRNVANLRIKETDRLAALATELGELGVPTEIHCDGISILPDHPPIAARIRTYDDHRMAMSFALAGLRLDGVAIRNAECVRKTFPEFFDLWQSLGR